MKNKRRGIIAICICMIFLCVSVYAMEYISKPDKKNNSSSKIDSEDSESKIVEPKIIIPQTIRTIEPKPTEVNTSNKNDYINKKEDSKNLDNVKTIIPKLPHVNDNIKIIIPKSSHVGDLVKVTTSNISYLSLDKVIKDGKVVDFSKYIEGDIEKDEHVIKFNEKGSYSFRFKCKDLIGKSFKYEVSIKIYPIIETKFSMPKIAYENDLVEIKTLFKNTEHVKWDIFKDGKSVSMKDVIEGTISDEGGKIKFKNKGEYELKTSSIDDTGRKFEYSSSITIHPELVVDFNMDKFTHIDKKALINLTSDNEYPVTWSIYKGNDSKDILKSLDNNLSNNGGYIKFNDNGIYTVKLTVKDKFGKVYEKCKEINVYPILSIDFNLPKTAYTSTQINVYTENINNLPVKWDIVKDSKNMEVSDVLNGNLNAHGGKICFKNEGEYKVTATITDKVGRNYSSNKTIKISKEIYSGNSNSLPTKPITSVDVTNIVKDGKFLVNISAKSKDVDGDEITYEYEGKSQNNYYKVGSHKVRVRAIDICGGVSEWTEMEFNIINSAPTKPNTSVEVTRTFKDGKFLVNISAKSTDKNDGDEITYEYEGKSEDNYYKVGSHVVKVRAKDNCGGVSEWVEIPFTISTSAPTKPVTNVDVTRIMKGEKFLVNIFAESTDADGDKITYEYEGKTDDNYYEVGSHTIMVRAKDNCGSISEWVEIKFTVSSSAPTAPTITRTPNGNSVAPNTPVKITATSSDADGDEITYIWENRPSETSVYSLGKNIVKVKAVDSTGKESPWSAIVFFVMDSNGSGGMALTGSGSSIVENGIEDATITNYTFTVPPVDGHSGNDFARVKGFNIKTNAWEQLDYATTENGITFSKTLAKNTYSKLDFYYYTDHTCMYNKSNITYSVEYYFE